MRNSIAPSDWRRSEKCGIVGLVGPHVQISDLYEAQQALEHRGNGPAGIAILDFDNNLIRHVAASIDELPIATSTTHIKVGMSHNRYRTSASTKEENTQPIVRTQNNFTLVLGHNGNIPDEMVASLRTKLKTEVAPEASDSVILTQVLIDARPDFPTWTETFNHILPLVKGAFSLTCFTEDGSLFAIRDPYGIRPLCLGQKDSSWVVASETVALDAIGAEYLRELLPGELVCLKPDGSYESIIYAFNQAGEHRCLLETIYFSRRKSYDGQNLIQNQRLALGRAAARRFRKKNIKIDWVVPILNSGLVMAQGASDELKIPLYEAIGVNGTKRSFIQNTPKERQDTVHAKHVVFDPKYVSEIAGKSILLCDDSAVRGTSLNGLLSKVKSIKNGGPSEIHILLGSEPVVDVCHWGVHLPNKEELLANKIHSNSLADFERKVAQFLDISSVTYVDRKHVEKALDRTSDEMCYHCFGGPSPTNGSESLISRLDHTNALKKHKVLFMASGNGTNVEELLRQMENGTILAQPQAILTNNAEAGVIQRAENHSLPIMILPSKGRLKVPADRTAYESELAAAILNHPGGKPNVIILAGWMLVLSDAFLQPLIDQGITIMNLHPALLSGKGQKMVMTSQGSVPEIRGADAIGDASKYSLEELPVTGVSVHVLKPSSGVDTGRVVLKEEVRRRVGETTDELTARIHAAEYRIFSTALQRVLIEKVA